MSRVSPRVRPKFTPGQVILAQQPYKIHETRDSVVWIIDCNSKYVAPFEAIGKDDVEVHLAADDHTLYTDPNYQTNTMLVFRGTKGWSLMTEAGRYEVRIMFYRPNRKP